MNSWDRYARFEHRRRKERCTICMIIGGLIAIVLIVAIPAIAPRWQKHRRTVHRSPGQPSPVLLLQSQPGGLWSLAATPAANPCTAGVFCVPEEDRCHTHSAELMLGGKTQACIDFETPPPPPPPPVVPPPDECTGHWCDHERYGEHETHDCAICDEYDGTCGWGEQPSPSGGVP